MKEPSFIIYFHYKWFHYSDFTKDSQNKTMAGSGFAVKIIGQIIKEVFLEIPKVCNL